MAGQKPVYNTAGTHIYVTSPTGDPWECPPDYLEVALLRGFELAEAPVDDGVHDDAPAPKATKAAAATKKTSGD